ncbi:MAG: DUF4474 domain-containing protein [Clostridia bacterium]|nr:DUF4474 domain-containing protein [Clostridia bacterium]
MKSQLLRIVVVIMAISLMVCSFASCQIAIEEEPAGGNDVDIAGPSDIFDDPSSDADVDNGNNGNNSNNSNSNNNGNNGGNYYPNNGGNSGNTNNGGNSGNNGNNNNNNNSGGNINIPQIDWAGTANDAEQALKDFYTHFDTPEERIAILRMAGYEYDAEQQIFYTHLNPWQRYFGFHDIYDRAAPITNMWYLTLKIDFTYGDYDWRLQWWKGQYGILEGAELGVYTKDVGVPGDFYECAADENLLKMEFSYYQSAADYNKQNPLFIRYEQEHWWLTGFKFGVTQPQKNVVKAVLYARDEDMADKIEVGLQNVTDDKGNWNGFTSYRPGSNQVNFYVRNGNVFEIVWKTAGYVNYSYMMDGNEDDADIPTE